MTERRDIVWRYKAVPVPTDTDGIQAVIDEWTSYGWEPFDGGFSPVTIGVMIFRKHKEKK